MSTRRFIYNYMRACLSANRLSPDHLGHFPLLQRHISLSGKHLFLSWHSMMLRLAYHACLGFVQSCTQPPFFCNKQRRSHDQPYGVVSRNSHFLSVINVHSQKSSASFMLFDSLVASIISQTIRFRKVGHFALPSDLTLM